MIMILNERNIPDCEILEEDEEEEEEEEEKNWKYNKDRIYTNCKQAQYLDDFIYRGEGNANIVLALPQDRKVIRFRKTLSASSQVLPDGGRARIIREIEFLRYVISYFLHRYVEPPEPLCVNHKDMIKVLEAIRPMRPEYRRYKDIVEDCATVYKDYAFLPQKMTRLLRNNCHRKPTFCVEIKPKQGFRQEFDQQFRKCTYCLTQYYKVKTGAINSRSSYCPYDLFSGDNERMKKSLRGLIKSPQNNFKIFKDGTVVYDSNAKYPYDIENVLAEWFATGGPRTNEQNLENFFNLINSALTRDLPASKPILKRNGKEILGLYSKDLDPQPRIDPDIICRAKRILRFDNDECDFAANGVPQGCVLGRILNMQQLPYLSTDLVYKVYSKHFETLDDDAVYSQMITIYRGENKTSLSNGEKEGIYNDSRVSLKSINGIISDGNGNESVRIEEDFQSDNSHREIHESGGVKNGLITIQELEILQNYLLATTAKDCSILIAFQEVDSTDVPDIPDKFIIRGTQGVSFMVNIGVLDLDPKSIHCIEKHRQRDANVLNSLGAELDLTNLLPHSTA